MSSSTRTTSLCSLVEGLDCNCLCQSSSISVASRRYLVSLFSLSGIPEISECVAHAVSSTYHPRQPRLWLIAASDFVCSFRGAPAALSDHLGAFKRFVGFTLEFGCPLGRLVQSGTRRRRVPDSCWLPWRPRPHLPSNWWTPWRRCPCLHACAPSRPVDELFRLGLVELLHGLVDCRESHVSILRLVRCLFHGFPRRFHVILPGRPKLALLSDSDCRPWVFASAFFLYVELRLSFLLLSSRSNSPSLPS